MIRQKESIEEGLHLALAVVYKATISPEIGRAESCMSANAEKVYFSILGHNVVLPPGAAQLLFSSIRAVDDHDGLRRI